LEDLADRVRIAEKDESFRNRSQLKALLLTSLPMIGVGAIAGGISAAALSTLGIEAALAGAVAIAGVALPTVLGGRDATKWVGGLHRYAEKVGEALNPKAIEIIKEAWEGTSDPQIQAAMKAALGNPEKWGELKEQDLPPSEMLTTTARVIRGGIQVCGRISQAEVESLREIGAEVTGVHWDNPGCRNLVAGLRGKLTDEELDRILRVEGDPYNIITHEKTERVVTKSLQRSRQRRSSEEKMEI
jgi:hypothetical protein